MRKGEFIFKILKNLLYTALSFADLSEAILMSGYGVSSQKIARNAEKIHSRNASLGTQSVFKKQLSVTLYKMKKDNLVKKSKSSFYITQKGLRKYAHLQDALMKRLPQKYYQATPDKKLIIAIFDVPEKERAKRNWLKKMLQSFDFTMLQKSVFVGRTKLPEEFLYDLHEFKLLDYVEIFEISKAGSIVRKI